MVTIKDTGRAVIIRASDAFYQFVNGWSGILSGFNAGCGVVQIPDISVDGGFKQLLVPPDQLELL